MQIVEYDPQRFDALARAAERAADPNLRHRAFVDYYYTANPWSRLYLATAADGEVLGSLGIEAMSFDYRGRPLELAFGTNFFALRSGVGGYLFLHWLRKHPLGISFGGSEDFHKIIRRQKWTYFAGIKTLLFNDPYEKLPGDPAWRAGAKWAARRIMHRNVAKLGSRIPAAAIRDLAVREEDRFTSDLLPSRSPFTFRFAATVEHLAWRYSTALPFVRYRLFRILSGNRTVGYVVWNVSPQRYMLAQCDGEDAETLAYGVLATLMEVSRNDRRPRTVILSSASAPMQRIFAAAGFRAAAEERTFALGLRQQVDIAPDTAAWLVNLDWGDNGLRAPFLDQA